MVFGVPERAVGGGAGPSPSFSKPFHHSMAGFRIRACTTVDVRYLVCIVWYIEPKRDGSGRSKSHAKPRTLRGVRWSRGLGSGGLPLGLHGPPKYAQNNGPYTA